MAASSFSTPITWHSQYPPELAEGGKLARAAVANPGQVFHLPGVGLGDIRDVQNQKRQRADPGAAFVQDRRAQKLAQFRSAQIARQPRLRLDQRNPLLQRPSDLAEAHAAPRRDPVERLGHEAPGGLAQAGRKFPRKIVQMAAHLGRGSYYRAQGPPYIAAALPSFRTGNLPHAEGPSRRQKFPQQSALPLAQPKSISQIKDFAL